LSICATGGFSRRAELQGVKELYDKWQVKENASKETNFVKIEMKTKKQRELHAVIFLIYR
jgi:hypothetical protein